LARPKGSKLSAEHRAKISQALLGNTYALGNKFTEEAKIKLSIARSGKGNVMYGKHHTEATKEKISRHNLESGHSRGINNPNWKGDNVEYSALHAWIRRHLSKPELCENCHENKRLVAANITGVYSRDFSNWKYICYRCHNYMDKTVNNLKYFKGN